MKKGIALLVCMVFVLATLSYAWPWSKKPATEKEKTSKMMKKETKTMKKGEKKVMTKKTTTKKVVKKAPAKPIKK